MNYFKLGLLASILFLNSSCSHSQEEKKQEYQKESEPYMNHLAKETSPYLLQHAKNPVDWYPWGEEALQKAKDENKLLIISIGYAACHWCHVMEHESFEDNEVAKFMNDNFVSIKIDREERPDIDQVYMDAVQLITGRGGWPLNAIALPDGRPIHGGTYFQKEQWLDVLYKVSQFAKNNPEKAEEYATNLTNGVKQNELILAATVQHTFTKSDLKTIFENWQPNIDYINGGHKRAPKFPLPVGYQYLLQHNHITNDRDALNAVTITLDKMAEGGIYDQIGGGFARYSTDEYWKAPHFEKMLYDNGQLVSLYASAYQVTKNPVYKTIVYESLEFIERELSDKSGGFYSSLDADSEGEEGKFYVWTQKELEEILKEDAPFIIDYYNVEENGNWEHGNNILLIQKSLQKIAKKHELSEKVTENVLKNAKNTLLLEREKRIRPGLDDKILTSWNALMMKGYIDSYRVFDDKAFLKQALKNANFILKEIKKEDGRLDRNFKNGRSTINGFLDDYAFTIEAFIELYQATFDEKWLFEAQELTEYTITHFLDNNSGMFFYTSDIDPALIARKMEVSDNVIPSSNSTMAKNLFKLGHYFYKDNFIKMSRTMLNNVKEVSLNSGAYYANWASLMAWFSEDVYDVAIVGNDFEAKRKELDQNYLPNVFLSGGKKEGKLEMLDMKLISGKTTIYVCQNKSCKQPVNETIEALEQLK